MTRFRAGARSACLAVLLAQAACVHVPSTAVYGVKGREPKAPAPQGLETQRAAGLRVESLVYHPSALPLSSFFKRLAHGEFAAAFRRLKLAYTPSNADNAALRTLLAHGYVPVLVNVVNEGAGAEDPSGLSFRLTGSGAPLDPIPGSELPAEFRQVNWPAVAANVYNTTLAVAACAALLAAEVALIYYSGGGNVDLSPLVIGDVSGGGSVLNPVKRTARIDYEDYLFSPRPLGPGERIGGLLFFKAPRGADRQDLHLEAAPRG
jgi:hypothetical protein